jgi:hypothetical protein
MTSLRVQRELVTSMALYEAVASVASQLFPAEGGAKKPTGKPISSWADLTAITAQVNG